ncbi:MAG TPA: hypothetical protein VH300_15465 [Thermoleophilaceae bacterium]|jgi:hypothetical protein|nr:hypothetical protein [Thermoleophilaceae bacterium]
MCFAGQAKLMKGSKTVGSAAFMGVVTTFPMADFFGAFTLPGGHVSVVDLGSFTAKTQTLAIVGGTGRLVERFVSESDYRGFGSYWPPQWQRPVRRAVTSDPTGVVPGWRPSETASNIATWRQTRRPLSCGPITRS